MPNIPINDNLEPVGVSKEIKQPELEEIELSEATRRKYQNRVHLTFWDRLRITWRGENEIGRTIGTGLDIAETFAPRWIAKIRTQIQYKQDTKMNWLKNRLKEKSTWRGIVTFLTAVGVSLSPDQATAIVTAGVALVGIFEAFFKEPQSEDAT